MGVAFKTACQDQNSNIATKNKMLTNLRNKNTLEQQIDKDRFIFEK